MPCTRPLVFPLVQKPHRRSHFLFLRRCVSVKNSRQQTEGFSPALLAALEQQTAPAVLATIVGRHGSTPREEGSKMLVLPDGSAVGSVGGGIMEYRTQQLARELLEPGAARVGWPPLPQGASDARPLRPAAAPWKSFAASGTGGMSHEA